MPLASDLKVCKKCGQGKPFADFAKRSASKDGLQPKCRPCNAEESKGWRTKNGDRYEQYTKEYRSANAEILRERSKKYRDEDPEKFRQRWKAWAEQNREYLIEKDRRRNRKFDDEARARFSIWIENNPEKWIASTRERSRRHQAAKRNACPAWVDRDQLRAIYERAVRLEKESGIPMNVDHIVPLQGELVSGLHVPWNLQIIPALDNRLKSNKFDVDAALEAIQCHS